MIYSIILTALAILFGTKIANTIVKLEHVWHEARHPQQKQTKADRTKEHRETTKNLYTTPFHITVTHQFTDDRNKNLKMHLGTTHSHTLRAEVVLGPLRLVAASGANFTYFFDCHNILVTVRLHDS